MIIYHGLPQQYPSISSAILLALLLCPLVLSLVFYLTYKQFSRFKQERIKRIMEKLTVFDHSTGAHPLFGRANFDLTRASRPIACVESPHGTVLHPCFHNVPKSMKGA
jgi:hypothetical protein